MSRSGELSQCKQCKDNGLVGSLRRGFGGVLMITARRGARAVLWLRVRHSALSPILSLRTTATARHYIYHVQHYSNLAIHSRLCVSAVLFQFPSFNRNAISLFHKSRVEMTVQLKRFIYWTDEYMIVQFLLLFNLETTGFDDFRTSTRSRFIHISQETLLWLQRWTT